MHSAVSIDVAMQRSPEAPSITVLEPLLEPLVSKRAPFSHSTISW
jgi:hypothetical protein